MKIARFHRYGDASVIRYDDVEIPEPGLDEVLIEVAATSFNPSETALRAGLLREITPVALPYALGWDVAGTVVATGAEVSTPSVGDRVIGWLDGGAAAQYARAPAHLLASAPTEIPLADAAALPLAGLTAWQAVFDHARVIEGQRVLVNGAGGGIGGFTVQLAKHAGAEVIATASPRSADRVRRQGADHVIDYTATALGVAMRHPVDTIINLVPIGLPQADEFIPLVRPGGTIVSITTPLQPPPDARITATHFITRNNTAQLVALVTLVDTGAVTVEVTQSYPLTELDRVHRRSETGNVHGKITIVP
ncbi:NADP-dependent oxidoreductase [Kutzneria buriramensis]|uniref:NADPH:quinone reductase-like Zn-dependent oxidoreductase n=1 Tax=Kutzneria buriramensis TaxID=1045776 RepID=A0A3E0H1N9_9PSEU|nr:NADP-dependent oxidoreductase [Kutzneria buriramensis]REH35746.1 NADPH:quinone reductase-like Zn-dependent oxidoreductase [Kutzneria buriramensis]